MCGIVGVICKDNRGLFGFDKDIFQDLLTANSVRGLDSTGVFSINIKNEAHIVKQAIDPVTFFRTDAYKDWATNFLKYQIVIGHNRKATTGTVSSANAHPFKEGQIILVHNGIFWDHKKLNKSVEVDSHALCHSFSTIGAKETLKEATGAFALAWYDLKERALFLWRNNERPLAIVETTSTIYIASELDMLKWVLARDKRFYKPLRELQLEESMLYRINMNPFTLTSETLSKNHPYSNYSRNSNNVNYNSLYPSVCENIYEGEIIPGWLEKEANEIKEKNYEAEIIEALPNSTTSWKGHKEFLKTYPFDSRILFRFGKIEELQVTPKRWEVEGVAYLPGKPPVKAFIYPMSSSGFTLSSLKAWRDSKTLIGEVSRMLRNRDNSFTLHLKSEIQFPECIKLWNGNQIPRLEWNEICATQKCHKCNGELFMHQPEVTSVNEQSVGIYKVLCPTCIIPQVKKDNVIESSNTSV